MVEKVKGLGSYFSSIEEKNGKKMDYWFKRLAKLKSKPHMEQLAYSRPSTLWATVTPTQSLLT
jgi:hypothetical protein